MKIAEKNPDAHPLSRASAIALLLMRRARVERFADLTKENLADVELEEDQVRCLTRSRRWLALVAVRPETTLAVCTGCGAVYLRVPGTSLPTRCSLTPGCHEKVSWAGRAKVVES